MSKHRLLRSRARRRRYGRCRRRLAGVTRGEIYRVRVPKGRGREQHGSRYAAPRRVRRAPRRPRAPTL